VERECIGAPNKQEYKLAANNGANALHGGQKGSRFVVFDAKQIEGTNHPDRDASSTTSMPGSRSILARPSR